MLKININLCVSLCLSLTALRQLTVRHAVRLRCRVLAALDPVAVGVRVNRIRLTALNCYGHGIKGLINIWLYRTALRLEVSLGGLRTVERGPTRNWSRRGSILYHDITSGEVGGRTKPSFRGWASENQTCPPHVQVSMNPYWKVTCCNECMESITNTIIYLHAHLPTTWQSCCVSPWDTLRACSHLTVSHTVCLIINA